MQRVKVLLITEANLSLARVRWDLDDYIAPTLVGSYAVVAFGATVPEGFLSKEELDLKFVPTGVRLLNEFVEYQRV